MTGHKDTFRTKPSNDAYRDNYNKIFGKKKEENKETKKEDK